VAPTLSLRATSSNSLYSSRQTYQPFHSRFGSLMSYSPTANRVDLRWQTARDRHTARLLLGRRSSRIQPKTYTYGAYKPPLELPVQLADHAQRLRRSDRFPAELVEAVDVINPDPFQSYLVQLGPKDEL
jgi:hypothetical protein